MTDARVFPYYFPTTAVFVDDNQQFLDSLELKLPSTLAYHMFTSPLEALQRINEERKDPPLHIRCFSLYRRSDFDDARRLIHLDLNLIEQEVSNANRFRDISVVVVDYDMPAMNGLDLMKRIRDSRVKKVLLTGVADEKIAVKAFNEGLIHRFIRKNDATAIATLDRVIGELQMEYFRDLSEVLLSSLLLKSPSFLTDPAFENLFERLQHEHAFVEYYLVEDPPGFLLLTADGTIKRLLVANEEALMAQLQIGKRFGAPQKYLDQLAQGKVIAYYFDMVDDFFDTQSCNWDDYFYPAQKLVTQPTLYYSILESPPVDIEFDADQSTYQAYVKSIDEQR